MGFRELLHIGEREASPQPERVELCLFIARGSGLKRRLDDEGSVRKFLEGLLGAIQPPFITRQHHSGGGISGLSIGNVINFDTLPVKGAAYGSFFPDVLPQHVIEKKLRATFEFDTVTFYNTPEQGLVEFNALFANSGQ